MQTLDTTPCWIDSAPLPRFPRLDRNLEVDVAIVGGGIAGITAAYLLKNAGLTVALVERARCATVDTGHTTAHLTAVTDLRLSDMIDTFGSHTARAVWDAGSAAIDQIVALIRREDLACDFKWVPGYLHAPLDPDAAPATEPLRREAAAARDLGIAAEFVPEVPVFARPGVKFAHQALFHPRKYLAGLLARLPGDGSHVFEETSVDGTEDSPLALAAGDFRIRCRDIFFATHTPLTGNTGMVSAMLFQTKLALYTSYALGARLPAGRLPEASFWDTSDPYYYLRVDRHPDHDYAIFGGEDHKTGQVADTATPFRRLEARLHEFLPDAQVDHRWSGQVIVTHDGLPFIGPTADHQHIATGFAGNGMTFGTLGAMMTADAILGRSNPWRELFDPRRKKVRGGTWDYLRENKDYPYYLLRDWISRPDTASLAEVPRDTGRIVNLGGRKVAASRDAAGRLTLCSAVCTHLKCIVDWNDAEKTWDCPCHGSRFHPDGTVISGPAEEPLEPLAPPPET